MNKLMVLTLLAVFFEVVSSVPMEKIQNDVSKPSTNANSIPRRQSPPLPRRQTIPKQCSKPECQHLTEITSASVKKPIKSNPDKQPNRTNIPTKIKPKSSPAKKVNPNLTSSSQNSPLKKDGQLSTAGNSSTSKSPMNANVAPGIPFQQPGETVTVEGKNGKIYVNDEAKYSEDKIFINRHQVHVRIREGSFYVNGNLVLKKGRPDHDRIYQSTYNLDFIRTTHFIMKIYSDGILNYGDNSGARVRVYYYIPKEFLNLMKR